MESSNPNENNSNEMESDPLDVSDIIQQDPTLVKDAQKDIAGCDVLVCGGCHGVFFFVEELQAHKTEGACLKASSLKCENEEKPQIWGFTLWKMTEIKKFKVQGKQVPTSWEIYQIWTKLDVKVKSLWITAGRNVQFIHRIAFGKVREIGSKDKDPLALDDDCLAPKKGMRTNKNNETEEFIVEKILGKKFNPRRRLWEYEVKWESYDETSWEPLANLDNCRSMVDDFEKRLKAEKEAKEKEKSARGRGRPRLNPNSTPTPKKIIIRSSSPVVMSSPEGRPQRSSKQKALNQVKQWCGTFSDDENPNPLKRDLEDDDDYNSDDSFEKKIKLESEEYESEDEEQTKKIISRPQKMTKIIHTYANNGNTTKLPANVLIPDAKGVVRISQKQLPSLSSGVYIMSKSSGIIKLDPTASKIATSGGQAIVKVSPKVGQTQIRIIKKDEGAKKMIQMKQASTPTTTSTVVISQKPKPVTPVVQHPTSTKPSIIRKDSIKKITANKPINPVPLLIKTAPQAVLKTPQAIVVKSAPVQATPTPAPAPSQPTPAVAGAPQSVEKAEGDTKTPEFDDSDDGIPEMEFPTDIPLPEPDSPPGEFVLDPCTGKVAGVEYPEQTENDKKLENIVKLAAADITEDDLKIDDSDSTIVVVPPPTVVATSTTTTTSEVTSTSPSKVPPPNSNILQRTLTQKKTQPPKILNQSVATKPKSTFTPLLKTTSNHHHSKLAASSPMRKITNNPKPKFNIATPTKHVITKKTVKKTVTPKTKPISMPSLEDEVAAIVNAPNTKNAEPIETVSSSTFTIATTSDRPMFITGDDGTIYQVAGQNEEGQTILVTQDSDGQQQCLLVTNEALAEATEGTDQQIIMGNGDGEGVVMQMEGGGEDQPLVAQVLGTEPPSPGGTHKVVVMLPGGDVMVTQVTPEEYATLELDK